LWIFEEIIKIRDKTMEILLNLTFWKRQHNLNFIFQEAAVYIEDTHLGELQPKINSLRVINSEP
jgi:hypothetical protein